MAIDPLLPAIVKQQIALQKLDKNHTSQFRDSLQYDPSGEENRAGRANMPSSAEKSDSAAIISTLPPQISEFLGDVARRHGLPPPTAEQLQSAYSQAQTYESEPVIIGESGGRYEAESTAEPVQSNAGTGVVNADIFKDKSNILPYNVRKEAFDYGRMLGALNRYAAKIDISE